MDKKVLILDDDESRFKSFKARFEDIHDITNPFSDIDYCKTAKDCIDKLSKNNYSVVMLDHDLSEETDQNIEGENTGSEVARWISRNPYKIENTKVIVHSLSVDGSKNMLNLIPNSIYIPLAWGEAMFNIYVKKYFTNREIS